MAKKRELDKANKVFIIGATLALLALIGGLIGIFANQDKNTKYTYLIDETTTIKNVSEGHEITLYTKLELPFWDYDDENESYEVKEIDQHNLLIKVVKNSGIPFEVTVSNAYRTKVYTVKLEQKQFPVESISLDEMNITFEGE